VLTKAQHLHAQVLQFNEERETLIRELTAKTRSVEQLTDANTGLKDTLDDTSARLTTEVKTLKGELGVYTQRDADHSHVIERLERLVLRVLLFSL
jgi:hypothetical protein